MDRLNFIKLMLLIVVAGISSLAVTANCEAQGLQTKPAPKEEIITATTYFSTDKLPAGKDALIMVQVEVKKGWHVYANPANPDYLYPVKLVVSSQGKIQSTKIVYPQGANFKDPQSNDVYKVYEDKVDIVAQIKAPGELVGKEEELVVTVEYQACDSVKCLPPAKCSNTYKVKVATEGEAIKSLNEEYFSKKAKN